MLIDLHSISWTFRAAHITFLLLFSNLIFEAHASNVIIPAGWKALLHVGTQWGPKEGTKYINGYTKPT
jgi:hypothetical protein